MSSKKKKSKPVSVNLFLETARELATGQPAVKPKKKVKKKVTAPSPDRRSASTPDKDNGNDSNSNNKPSSKEGKSTSLKERRSISKASETDYHDHPAEVRAAGKTRDRSAKKVRPGDDKKRKRKKSSNHDKKHRHQRSRPAEHVTSDDDPSAPVGDFPSAAVAPQLVPEDEIEPPRGYPVGPADDNAADTNNNNIIDTRDSYTVDENSNIQGGDEHAGSQPEDEPRDEEDIIIIDQGRPSKKESSSRRRRHSSRRRDHGKRSKKDRHRDERRRHHHKAHGDEELVDQSSGMLSIPKQDVPIYPNEVPHMNDINMEHPQYPPQYPHPMGEPVVPLNEHDRNEMLAQEHYHHQQMLAQQRGEEMPLHAYPHPYHHDGISHGEMQRQRSTKRRSKSRSRGDGLRRSKSKRNRRDRDRHARRPEAPPHMPHEVPPHELHQQHADYPHYPEHAYHPQDVAPVRLSKIVDEVEPETDEVAAEHDNITRDVVHVVHRGIVGEGNEEPGEGVSEGMRNSNGNNNNNSRVEEEEAQHSAHTPDENDGSDGTAPSGGEEYPHEEEQERVRRSSKAKRKKGKGNNKKRGMHNSKEKGGSLDKGQKNTRTARSAAMSDAETLDTLSARRAQEVMKKAKKGKHDGEATVTLGILERFLPGRKVPGAQTAAERAEEEGFLEKNLPDMGENESMASDALVRDAAKIGRTSIFRVEVPQNFSYIVERRAKFHRRIDAGWHPLMPFIDKVSRVHSLRIEPMTIPQHQSFTRDSVPVHTGGVLFVQITDPVAASYAVDNPYRSLLLLAQACLSNTVGKMSCRQAVVKRPDIGRKLGEEINDTARCWGLWVRRVEISQLEPPPETRALLQLEAEARLQNSNSNNNVYSNHGFNSRRGNNIESEEYEEEEDIYEHDNTKQAVEEEELVNAYSNHNIHDGTESMGTETIERELKGAGLNTNNNSEGDGDRNIIDDRADMQSNISHAAISVTSGATTYDPFLDDSLSDQAALGASWFTGATANTRNNNSTPPAVIASAPPLDNNNNNMDTRSDASRKNTNNNKKNGNNSNNTTASGNKPPKMPAIKV